MMKNNFKIQKNIPIPSTTKSILKDMEVGDSIACSLTERNLLRVVANTLGIKVVTRKLKDDFYRVWKIK
tara:strand:- start:1575 stop:1781 length:207 start_codon:yes stop_codon:yes gene_type:complete